MYLKKQNIKKKNLGESQPKLNMQERGMSDNLGLNKPPNEQYLCFCNFKSRNQRS